MSTHSTTSLAESNASAPDAEAELFASAEKHWAENATSITIPCGERTLQGAYLPVASARTLVVLASGRTETFLKYTDLVYELNRAGYSVFTYDHRGQGLSERELNNARKGHIDDFNIYVDDLRQVFQHHIEPRSPGHLVLLAHSMGGAIGTLYTEQFPNDFDALAVASPMYGLRAGAAGRFLASTISHAESWFLELLGGEPGFIPGVGSFSVDNFDSNPLTHSPARFTRWRELVERYPQIDMGEPTTRWVYEAYKAFDRIFADVANISIPMLLLQAAGDRVVSNHAQDRFVEALRDAGGRCECISIPEARHELFNESPQYRQPAMAALLEFLEQRAAE